MLLARSCSLSRRPAGTLTTVKREPPNEDLYDALTGLPNRGLTLDRAERMLARAGRQSGIMVGALFIDIDWFKDVNEKLGNEAGDQLLKIVRRAPGERRCARTTRSGATAATSSCSWSNRLPAACAWTRSPVA